MVVVRTYFSARMLTTYAYVGDVFDVTRKKDVYGKGGSYNIFAGKDCSRGLGKSSLKSEDAVPDYSTLPENEMKVLDDWHSFFTYVVVLLRIRVSFDSFFLISSLNLTVNATTSSGVSPICQKQYLI